MSFAGLKKKFNKANQYMCERIGGAETTKVSDEFVEMEKKTELTHLVVNEMVDKTKELLYPNPTLRAKVLFSSKMKSRHEKYPHPEKTMGETMVRYGNLIGKEGNFGQSLIQTGVTLNEVSEIKYTFEETVKKKFLEPLSDLQLKEVKECMQHRKKLEGRRLDYDFKKRKKSKGLHVPEAELTAAEDKYNESLKLAAMAMQNLVTDIDTNEVSRLADLSEAFCEYHNQCADKFRSLTKKLRRKIEQKKERDVNSVWTAAKEAVNDAVEPLSAVSGYIGVNGQFRDIKSKSIYNITSSNGWDENYSQAVNGWKSAEELRDRPICRALYDFAAQNNNELEIKEGDVIELKEQIDDNWFEGTLNGREGLFPIAYVEVLVPLS